MDAITLVVPAGLVDPVLREMLACTASATHGLTDSYLVGEAPAEVLAARCADLGVLGSDRAGERVGDACARAVDGGDEASRAVVREVGDILRLLELAARREPRSITSRPRC